MTGNIDEKLDLAMREMTEYPGDAPALLEAAFAQTDRGVVAVVRKWGVSPWFLAASLALIGVIGVGVLLPTLGEARRQSPVTAQRAPVELAMDAPGGASVGRLPTQAPGALANLDDGRDTATALDKAPRDWRQSDPGFYQQRMASSEAKRSGAAGVPASAGISAATSAPAPDTERFVVRKATIEILTPDVSAAFLKASHLVSDAAGEYVQESSMTGAGKDAQGNLTLRVASGRLDATMNELRTLGTIRSESMGGEDVTTQIVDIGARVRNEERVETELLELLTKRADAPLKEILELRERISEVRQRIEQYNAQQQKLSRLVSLATVLVIIRAEPVKEKEPAKESSTGAYFRKTVSGAWKGGLQSLSDSLAWFVETIVGGLAWWCLLTLAAVGIWRARRWRLTRMAAPPLATTATA